MADDSTYASSHVGICVSDIDRSMRFYCEGLGFEPAERYELDSDEMPGLDRSLEVEGPIKVISQMLQSGPMKVELLAYPGRSAQGTPSESRGKLGLTHLSFNVEKVDSAAARLVLHGGSILEQTRSDAGIVLLFLTDPDGTRIELMGGAG
jgi:catechol 2,3-dioxygenase-like lactoylglutathione lyase family enzyme